MSNWEKQIEEHCVRGALSTCVYYGTTRDMTAKELSQYDVVITTYQTVTGDAEISASIVGDGPAKKKKKVEGTLFDVRWKVREALHKPSTWLTLFPLANRSR